MQNSDLKKLSLGTFTKLTRASASASVFSFIERGLQLPHGLTDSQFAVMEALLHLGPLSANEIAQKILKSPGNITTVIDNLVKKGLVVREVDQLDRRRQIITLTPLGLPVIKEAFDLMSQKIEQCMTKLSEAELTQLGELCKKLGKSI